MVEVDASGVVYIAYIAMLLGIILVVGPKKKGPTYVGIFVFTIGLVYAVAQRDALTLAIGAAAFWVLAAIGAVVLGFIFVVYSLPWMLWDHILLRTIGMVISFGSAFGIAYFLVESFG
jgi:hypothetical protein